MYYKPSGFKPIDKGRDDVSYSFQEKHIIFIKLGDNPCKHVKV